MKKQLIGLLFILFVRLKAYNQTVIPQTTTAYSLSKMANGVYRIITTVDTLDLTKDTAVKIHDTIKIATICPVCATCPKVDTAYIQSLKICPVCVVCPAPIVCPVCPTCPKQRTVVGVTLDLITNKKTFTYDDGTITTL